MAAMPDVNKANRQVCDVDIRVLKTGAPYLFFDTANTTTAGLTADSVYAMAKGSRHIAFANPMEGTMTIEAQVYPFKFFALMTDGVIHSDAVIPRHRTIKCTTAGELDIPEENGTISGVFCYPEGSYGDESALVQEGKLAGKKYSASGIEQDRVYEVGYIVTSKSGVQRISFSNSNLPPDYKITMSTVDKDEEGLYTPYYIIAYKASIQRNFELSFTSEGDPASVTLTSKAA